MEIQLTLAEGLPYISSVKHSNMKKILLSSLLITTLSFFAVAETAGTKIDEKETCMVSGGVGSLSIEAKEKTKITITVTNQEGSLVLSEVSSESGKLQLLGLSTGLYEVEIKGKKNSRVFRVEVQ